MEKAAIGAAFTEVEPMNTIHSAGLAAPAAGMRLAAGLFALALGAFFVWSAGFAHAQALHETAHDMRHAFGFPCH